MYISVRPWIDYFLNLASRDFEIIVFTGSDKIYADKVLDLIDPKHTRIKHRVYRNSCLSFHSFLIKDLNVLGRDLSKTVIIDNNPISFAFQVSFTQFNRWKMQY